MVNKTLKKIIIGVIIIVIATIITYPLLQKDDTGDTIITQTHSGSGDNVGGDKIVQNPEPPNKLSYNVISLNKKINDTYQSVFEVVVEIPLGGTNKNVSYSTRIFSNCTSGVMSPAIVGYTTGTRNQISYNVICYSPEKVEDKGNLFFI